MRWGQLEGYSEWWLAKALGKKRQNSICRISCKKFSTDEAASIKFIQKFENLTKENKFTSAQLYIDETGINYK